jgi:PAS domain S-box-containing protein
MAAFDSLVDGVLVMVTGGGMGVLGTLYLRYRDQKSSQQKDVVGQLEAYSASLVARIDRLDLESDELHRKHVQCQVENEGLRRQVDALQTTVDNLRGGMDPMYATIVNPLANLIFDQEGVVKEATPFITSLFHWYESELIGKNFKRLLPPRFHPEHDAWMRQCVETNQHPPDRVLRLIGITKQGEEFPIYVRFKSWRDGPRWMFNAYIQERPREEGEISRDGIPVFAPPGVTPVPVVTVPDPAQQPPVPPVRPAEEAP